MSIRVRFARLHCNNANEEGIFSNGDEPWVILATIAPGGPLNRRLIFAKTQTFSGVDGGENRHPNLDLLNEDVDGSFAVVGQVVEHDNSEKELVFNLATAAAQVAFVTALLDGETSIGTLRAIVADALHDGVVAAALPFVDDDDAIGHPAVFTISAATIDALEAGQPIFRNRGVAGNNANYTLRFEVQRME